MNHKQHLENIDTKMSSSLIKRSESNNIQLNPEGNEIFAMSNKLNSNILNNSLAVPLTPIGCNKASLAQNNNSSNGNLFGKYLMNKKLSGMKQSYSLSRAASNTNISQDQKLEGVTPISSAENYLMSADMSGFENEQDGDFSQCSLDTNNNNNYYYYNSNSALSKGNMIDTEDLDLDMHFTSQNNDMLYYPKNDYSDNVDDTLKNIYKDNKETLKRTDTDEFNYTINPMITQINPKHFSSPEYNIDDIDAMLQEAEDAETNLPSALNSLTSGTSNLYSGNSAIPSKSVSDYNIFIKGEDGIELPAQEVLKKLNFNFLDGNKNHSFSGTSSSQKENFDAVKLPSKNLKKSSSKFAVKPAEIAAELMNKNSKTKISPVSSLKTENLPKEDKLKSNTGLEEYKCEHSSCKKSFSRPYDLVRHTKTIHSKQKKLYRCLICIKELGEEEGHKKTFSRGDALSRHIKLKHELKIGDESLRFAMKFAKDNVEYVEN